MDKTRSEEQAEASLKEGYDTAELLCQTLDDTMQQLHAQNDEQC